MKTSHGWFDVTRFSHGITMIAEPWHDEDVKSYLVEGERDVAVLDTGMGVSDFAGLAATLSDRDPIVLQSHAHFDHIGDSHKYQRVLIHPAEADDLREGYPNERFRSWFTQDHLIGNPLPEGFDPETAFIPAAEPTGELNHGDRIDLGGRELEVFYTPGHSPGGITLLDRRNRALFPGDAVYAGPMYSWRTYSDPVRYRESLMIIRRLCDFVDAIYPSHNNVPLSPDEVRAMCDAYEEIWAGREADRVEPDKHIFQFETFAFHLKPGAYGPGAPITPSVAELRTRILDSRRELLGYLATLDERRRTELRDAGGWSVKDHLAHLTRWERSMIFLVTGRPRHEGMGVPREIYEAEYVRDGDINVMNNYMQEQDRDLSWDDALGQFNEQHESTIATLGRMTDEDLMRSYKSYAEHEEADERDFPVVFLLAGNTTFHYQTHLVWMQEIAGFGD